MAKAQKIFLRVLSKNIIPNPSVGNNSLGKKAKLQRLFKFNCAAKKAIRYRSAVYLHKLEVPEF